MEDEIYVEYDGVLRSCANPEYEADKIDDCYEGVDTEFCICDSELCNSANNLQKISGKSIVLIVTFL